MSPLRSWLTTEPAVSGRLRTVSVAERTTANPPRAIVGRLVGWLAMFQRPRLPFASVARARNAYACPSPASQTAAVAFVFDSHVRHGPRSIETWTS